MQVAGSETLVYIGNSGDPFVDQKRLARNRKKNDRSEAFADLSGNFYLARFQG